MKNVLALLVLLSSGLSHADVYEVPGVPADQGSYEMAFELKQHGDEISAEYVLPLNLTGTENRIEVRGTLVGPNQARLSGAKGQLACDLLQKVCQASYNNLEFDLGLVKSRLENLGLSLSDIESRLDVSRRFQEDPIGVIRFSSPEI